MKSKEERIKILAGNHSKETRHGWTVLYRVEAKAQKEYGKKLRDANREFDKIRKPAWAKYIREFNKIKNEEGEKCKECGRKILEVPTTSIRRPLGEKNG